MNSREKSCLLFFAFFIPINVAIQAGDVPKEMNEKASQLYRDGKYGASLDIWYDMAKSGNTDPNLYFNIGSAEAIQDHIPESILAFEKALRFKPADNEIREALKIERSKIENAVIPVNPFFLIGWYQLGLALLRPGGWVLIGLLMLLVALIQWLVSVKGINEFGILTGKKIWFFFAAGILFIIIGFLSYHQLHRLDEAIVMISCECRQAPSTESPLTRTLHPGEKVRITDQISEWNKVSLLNLDEGWIKQDCLKPIEVEL